MNGFASDWLALREPADLRARDAGLLARAADCVAGRCPATVTDLACGTGATRRAMGTRLPASQRWRLVDHDAALLQRALSMPVPAGIDRLPLRADLAREVEAVVALDADLVATSAFLDLVSDAWLRRLATALARHRRPLYAALSYDGRVACGPADPLDARVLAAFDAHQRRDKGLGGALGPDAAEAAALRLRQAGFDVTLARADWRLDEGDSLLQRRLIVGWHDAVAQTGHVDAVSLDAWLGRRLAAVDEGRSRLVVGHLDLLALPAGPGRG
jgi:hypothetical protein